MEGKIFLIKKLDNTIVPALCIESKKNKLKILQIRNATKEDKFNSRTRQSMEVYNRGRKQKDQIKIREKYEIDSLFIGKPLGLKNSSTIMLKKLFYIKPEQIVREISEVPKETIFKCNDLILQINSINNLRKELIKIKRKITLAQFNNEKYSHLEKKADEIISEIGYLVTTKKNNRAFMHYRETPSKHIKIYKG